MLDEVRNDRRDDETDAGLLSARRGWRVVCVDPDDDGDHTGERISACGPEGDEFGDATRLLRERRRAMGAHRADALWFGDPLHAWLACLEGRSDGLDHSRLVALSAGMREVLAMRDALIASLLAPELDEDALTSMASSPHSPPNVRRLTRMIEGTFGDASRRPDPSRCARGIGELERIVRDSPESYRVQPLAAAAYLRWWARRGGAVECALRALTLDGRCTLAAIVLAAEEHGIVPAWAGCADRRDP
ncbi:hypothetical protein G1C96_0949 [Bifidobacterium sp. DSM 109958]|uniref:DUF4192 family protein n=1 Tax=Bifidobacterium moraviense TaxID=2675323 RepID=A0A7Y0HZM4_9BIFI|nr:hypothetical protein [Bifidobacterium sp. DSM 109958]NMN00370.1 hypothetical protein [Bifidobacterium sp. DSM 109958]